MPVLHENALSVEVLNSKQHKILRKLFGSVPACAAVQEVGGTSPSQDKSVSECFIEGWREPWSSSSIVVTPT
jgi:hypothetical protein